MTTFRFSFSLARTLMTHTGALSLVILSTACVASAPPEPDEGDVVMEEPAARPQMSQSCASSPNHNCCLAQCGEWQYDCNFECRSGDVPNRSQCYADCNSSYNSCLNQCDVIWLHTPPW